MIPASEASSRPRELRGRWLVAWGASANMFVVWGSYGGFGVFLPSLSAELGWTRGTISTAFGLGLLIGGPLGMIFGYLTDRYDPRKLMTIEVLAVALSFLLLSIMRELWQLYLFLTVVQGIGIAGSYLIPTATVGAWFTEKRGLATGLVLAGHGLGYFVGPPLSAFLIQELGWRNAYLVLFALVLIIGIPSALQFRKAPRPALSTDKAASQAKGLPGRSSTPDIALRSALRSRLFWMLFLSWPLVGIAQMTFGVHVVPFIVDKGIPITLAAASLSFYGLGSIAGRLLFGAFADRLPVRIVFGTGAALCALSLGLLFWAHSLLALFAVSALFGVAISGTDTTFLKGLPDIVGTRYLGAWTGACSFGWRLGGSAAPAFAGLMFDATGSYAIPFSIAILCSLLSPVALEMALRSRPAASLKLSS